MPYLYESRQNKRVGRESLDCATALQELTGMGVENIITFDAHDARVQNATPLHGFETVQPSYQFIKALLRNEEGLRIDNEHFAIISPDEGSMNRAIYLANILGVDMGMYYKRLDYSRRVNGRHPIAAYEFLGPKLEGKDMILIDDMISSGDTVLKIASLLKREEQDESISALLSVCLQMVWTNLTKASKTAYLTSFLLPTLYTRHRSFLKNHIILPVI